MQICTVLVANEFCRTDTDRPQRFIPQPSDEPMTFRTSVPTPSLPPSSLPLQQRCKPETTLVRAWRIRNPTMPTSTSLFQVCYWTKDYFYLLNIGPLLLLYK